MEKPLMIGNTCKNNVNIANTQKGFTLFEVLVTTLILTVGVLGLIAFVTTGVRASELAKDVTVATSHAEFIFEEMSSRATLDDITSNDWNAWITANNLNTLGNESITITFEDPDEDPLNITVAIAWQTGSRPHSLNMVTEMSK